MKRKKILLMLPGACILIILCFFLAVQIYEGTRTHTYSSGNIVSNGTHYFIDLSMQPLSCGWDEEIQNIVNCTDTSENKICVYDLNYTFTGECFEKWKIK